MSCGCRHAFNGMGLADGLCAGGVRRVLVSGLAADYRVLGTVLEARANGFAVLIVQETMRAVEVGVEERNKKPDRGGRRRSGCL